MNTTMRIALLLTVAFMLCNPLAAIAAGGLQPNILLSVDKLKYKKGGPKAATLSLPQRTATPSPGGPKAKTTTVAQATQQAATPPQKPKVEATAAQATPPEKPKAKTAAAAQATQQAATPPKKPKASPPPATRAAPSFNCAKASNAVERAICANPDLAEMDVRMAADYKKALKTVPNRTALRAEQRQWLRHMHSQCANAPLQCIQEHYGTRSAQLRAY